MNEDPMAEAAVRHQVGARTVPPWDRDGTDGFDLSPLIGTHVAVGAWTAARLLATHYNNIASFVRDGLLKDGRIVERRFEAGAATFVCVTACYWTRLYLEPGEIVGEVVFGSPALWRTDVGGCDAEGRACVRVRARGEGASDDLTIVTDRRSYRLRLTANPTKVTMACSWTYPDGAADVLTPAGENRRWARRRAGATRITRFVIFELGKSASDLVMDWADALEPRRNWQLRKYKALRARARIPVENPHPPRILAAVLQRLLTVGTILDPEVRQWLPVTGDGTDMCRQLRELATKLRRDRLPLPVGLPPSAEDMLDPFPFLRGLPETCYEDEETYQEAPARARAFAWGMKGLAPAAALFCTVAPRYIRSPAVITETLRQCARLERIADQAGLMLSIDDPAAIGAVLDHLFDAPECAAVSEATRYEMARSFVHLCTVLRRYIRFKDPEGDLGLSALRPAQLPDATVTRLHGLRRKLMAAGRSNRKKKVFRYAGKLAQIEFAADLNLEQLVMTTKALRSTAAALGEQDFIDVPVTTTIVDHKGRLRPGRQVCIWRVWDPLAYHRLLRAKTSRPSERTRLDEAIASLEAGLEMCPIHEYRSSRGELGGTPIEPFFVRYWRYGLVVTPANIPARVRNKRNVVLRNLQLPGFWTNLHGLLGASKDETRIWRASTRQHRVVCYLDPLEHALRFAHLGLSTVLENCARSTSWLQQTQDQSGWNARPLNKVMVAGFLAHDKIPVGADPPEEMTWFPVGPKHQAEAMELAKMTCDRCGYADGRLPEIPHLPKIRWKRPDDQAWTFSYNGSVLSQAYLLQYLLFLLPGWGRITFHDVRHLGANAAYEEGVPGWIIRLTLNHGRSDLWEYYAEQSAAQKERLEAGHLRTRFERSAQARSTRAWA